MINTETEPIKMSRDVIIPEGHFGSSLVTFCAIICGITPNSGSLEYKYELHGQNDNQNESPPVLPDLVEGKSQKREVIVGSRRLYVCDEFGHLSRETYKRYNSVSGVKICLYVLLEDIHIW